MQKHYSMKDNQDNLAQPGIPTMGRTNGAWMDSLDRNEGGGAGRIR